MIRIKKIQIKNYRSCHFTEFSPNTSLSALIGPNGSGKTNVLTAVTLLKSLLNLRSRRYFIEDPIISTCSLKVWYDWNGNQIIHSIKLNIDTDERNQDEIVSSKEAWYMFDITNSKKRIKIPIGLFVEYSQERKYYPSSDLDKRDYFTLYSNYDSTLNKKAFQAIEEIISYLRRLKYYSASQFTDPSSCPISFEAERASRRRLRRSTGTRGHQNLLYDMFEEYKHDSVGFSQFKNLIGPDGINLIDELEFNEIQTSSSEYKVMTGGKVKKEEKINLLVIPGFRLGKNLLSPSQLSEGTFKTIALIFYLVTDRSSLLIIEEPEVCVHHGLLESIIELIMIYSKEKQIFISTHSDAVLDSLDIENIFKVKREKIKGTIVSHVIKSMKSKDLIALKEYLHREGSLGEYWKHGDLESD